MPALTPDSDFFVLGGHSLLAVTMLAAAERDLGRTLPLGEFLADPTVVGLGRMLAARPREVAPALVEGSVHPATDVQRRFWFLDRVPELRRAYLAPAVLEFTGSFTRTDVDLLASCVAETMARHPALRSRFSLDAKTRSVVYTTDGSPPPVQVVEADPDRLAAACWTPFDLAREAPARSCSTGSWCGSLTPTSCSGSAPPPCFSSR